MSGFDWTERQRPLTAALQDALLAARLCSLNPALGGIILRGGDDWERERVIAEFKKALPPDCPVRRVPPHVEIERLAGGMDLTASLAGGRVVAQAGLLAEAGAGLVIVPMAERIDETVAGLLAADIDREGRRYLTLALDDGQDPDERPRAGLADRLAFSIALSDRSEPVMAEAGAGEVTEEDAAGVLAATGAVLGIASMRPPLFALRAARALAETNGRAGPNAGDLATAARLILGPRATRLPDQAPGEEAPTAKAPPPTPDGDMDQAATGPLSEMVVAATVASLPADMLDRIANGLARHSPTSRAHGAGERRRSSARGRPLGARRGTPRAGVRLSLIDTLRAAAPWQALRGGGRGERVRIRRDDLHIRRFETRADTLTIFAVDASGSSAVARLGEAKGAVELLLAQAYVKRAEVALIAFRGAAATVLLPPTRSLTRARRALADLPGGGGTPIAAGLEAAGDLAELARARGRTPFIVVLTDGRANVARDGGGNRATAQAEAEEAATKLGRMGIASAFVDISPRPGPQGQLLAAKMRARYLALPRADARAMHAAVLAAQSG